MRILSAIVLLSIVIAGASCSKPRNCICTGSETLTANPDYLGSYNINKMKGVDKNSPQACAAFVESFENRGYHKVDCKLNEQ